MLRSLIIRRVRKWLLRHEVAVARAPCGVPTGFDLEADLPLVITSDVPTIYDVGANIGQSIDLFHRIFPSALIVAFEPTGSTFKQLSRKYVDSRICLREVALGRRNEVRGLREFEKSYMNSVLEIDDHPGNRFGWLKPQRIVTITITTLDAERVELGTEQIDLLKIDTQGSDLEVLLGAQDTFSERRINNVLIELNFSPMYKAQANALDVLSFLEERGFALVDFYEIVRQKSRMAWCTALFTQIDAQYENRLPNTDA